MGATDDQLKNARLVRMLWKRGMAASLARKRGRAPVIPPEAMNRRMRRRARRARAHARPRRDAGAEVSRGDRLLLVAVIVSLCVFSFLVGVEVGQRSQRPPVIVVPFGDEHAPHPPRSA